ncbi:hypothetical protein Adt_48147 [Abeliophyllum distichum]|uniref:Uncharacterized protein n=1 Tax=Abeliophyllum distichum TaxID=126358 RepID=A0ABD1NRT1_9LAMI
MSKTKILAVFMGLALFCYLTKPLSYVSNGDEPNALLSSMPSIKGDVDIPSKEPKLNNVGGLPHRKLLDFCGCPVFMGFALFCYLTHVSNGEEPNALLSSMPSVKGVVDIPSEEPKLNNVGGLPHRKLLDFCGCPGVCCKTNNGTV